MRKQKIAQISATKDKQKYLFSGNDCEDKNCPLCKLMQKAKIENRELTENEIRKAMLEPT
jgi:hypothetical protein